MESSGWGESWDSDLEVVQNREWVFPGSGGDKPLPDLRLRLEKL